MKIEALIFDMDGVIIDSEPHYFELEENLFETLKLPISEVEHRTFVGMSMKNLWKKVKDNHATHYSIEQLVDLHQNIMVEFFENADDLILMPNLAELLPRLKGKYKLAIASSSSHKLIDIITTKLNIRNFFDCFVSGEEVENSKPDPEIFMLTAQKLGVNPANCLVIEDSEHGVNAALAAGMKCLGFYGSNTYTQEISAAHKLIGNFSEVGAELLSELQK